MCDATVLAAENRVSSSSRQKSVLVPHFWRDLRRGWRRVGGWLLNFSWTAILIIGFRLAKWRLLWGRLGAHSVVMYLAFSHPAISSTIKSSRFNVRHWMWGLTCKSLACTISSVGPRPASLAGAPHQQLPTEDAVHPFCAVPQKRTAFSLVVMMMS